MAAGSGDSLPGSETAFDPKDDALQRLTAAIAVNPADSAAHRALAAAYRSRGNELEARVEECAADAIAAGTPLVIYNLATVYFMKGHRASALKWYDLALLLDSNLAIARRNRATILFDDGRREEARAEWHRAYSQQCVFVTSAPQERARILVLAASGYGNIPLTWLLPQHFYTQIQLLVAYATPEAEASLPQHDLVLNAIGDADVEGATYATVSAVQAACRLPFLNDPACVSRTRRDRLPHLLQGIPDVDLPTVVRGEGQRATLAAAAERGLTVPLLLRPAASHGGEGLVRLDVVGDLGPDEAGAWYASPFRDYCSHDGYWRKYRIIFVDREPYPYHLAISGHWLVHYATADMLSDPAKCAEERRFLDDPVAALGERAMQAIRAIGKRLDLDYAGVDFTLLPDGQVLVFEANATMLVHPEKHAAFGYKNPPVNRILDAFQTLLARRIEAARMALR